VLGSTPASVDRARRVVPRTKETIGDLDLLAETTDPAALMARFTGSARSTGHRSRAGTSRRPLLRGPQVDLMAMPPGRPGRT
jgi:DNA polymerase/3'-5' exonuclease PolX